MAIDASVVPTIAKIPMDASTAIVILRRVQRPVESLTHAS
jgi:hypothetical protein